MKVLNRVAKLCIGCYILILAIILVIVPNLPLIGILMACKYVEAYVYFYLYGAEVIRNYDFFKLSSGTDKNIRTTLVILNGKLDLKDIKELVVTSLIDAHTVDGELCFSQLTKRHVAGTFNNYWIEEEQFSLNDHIFMWGEGETLYNNTELQQILVRLKDENQNVALSPWFLTVIPLQHNKTALVFRCHPVLKDLELVRTLFEEHKQCHHETNEHRFLDEGFINLTKNLSLTCWNLAEFILNSLKSKALSGPKEPSVRKVLMWSKPVNAKMFEEIAKHLKVNITDVLLGCVSHVANDIDSVKYECPLSITESLNKTITSGAYPIKFQSDDPVSTIIKNKETLSDLSVSGKLFTSALLERSANWILPNRFSKYVTPKMNDDIKIYITNLLAEEEGASLLSAPVDLISVWCEESKDSAMEICLTNTLGQVIIGTDAYHTKQSTSSDIFIQFEKVIKKLTTDTGVFPHYFQ